MTTNNATFNDQVLNNLAVTTTDSVPIYKTLPPTSYQKRGSIAFDDTIKLFAFFDGLVWQYLTSSGITNIVNIGTGSQVFASFNPNLPGNKVAQLRTFTVNQNNPAGGGNGLVMTQNATTIDYSLDASIGDLTNVSTSADAPAVNDFLAYRGTNWTNISLVGVGIQVTHQPTTTTLTSSDLQEAVIAGLETDFSPSAIQVFEDVPNWNTSIAFGAFNRAPTIGALGGNGHYTVGVHGVYLVRTTLQSVNTNDVDDFAYGRIIAQRGIDAWALAVDQFRPQVTGMALNMSGMAELLPGDEVFVQLEVNEIPQQAIQANRSVTAAALAGEKEITGSTFAITLLFRL